MLLLQAVCGIALVGLVSVGILGLVFGAAVGRRCAWCPSAACVDTRWWACQSTEQPICNYTPTGNGTASIECTGVRPSSSSSADAAAAGGRVHWGMAAEQALLCIRHGIPLYTVVQRNPMDQSGCSGVHGGWSMARILEGQCCFCWSQGASVVMPSSYSASPVGMELVGLCRRACRGSQPAAPAQAPAPPPPAILI